MASFADFGKMLGEAGEAIMKPAVPELAERGTPEAPALLSKLQQAQPEIAQRPNQPQVTSQPNVERHLEMTYDPHETLADGIQSLKTFLGGAIKRDPNLPKDIQQRFLQARQAEQSARHIADYQVSKMLEPMQNDPATQTTIWAKHLLASDELAQAMRDGRPDIMGQPIEDWKKVVSELQSKVDADPQIAESHKRYRDSMDAVFGDAQSRGWFTPDRYLDDYTPIRKLHAVADATNTAAGGDLRLNLLNMLQSRTGAEGERESNLIKVLRETLAQYHRHVAQHELWMDLTSDPTLDMTDHVPPGTDPPKGFSRYNPGPGAIGYEPKSPEQQMLDGVTSTLPDLKQGHVFPTPIVDALNQYKRTMQTDPASRLYKGGNSLARQYTVYNPGLVTLHRASDLLLSLIRAPEFGGSPLGVLKWYGTANKTAFKGTFGKGGNIITVNGQPIDAWELAINQGLAGGTMADDVGGSSVPVNMLQNLPEAQRNHDNWLQGIQTKLKQMMSSTLRATELTPRIAAGLEAFERTGDPNEFGRVGREITFPYGAGAPRWATFPALRLIAPFIQFHGLAADWILNTLNITKDTPAKVKMLAGMAAVPTALMLWNGQNQNYQQVEDSLHERERNMPHIIVPDPMDPANVRRDINGNPVVFRFRYWVPEEVAKVVGLANLPSRIKRVVQGKDTPIEFAQQTAEQAGTNLSGLLMTPEIVQELMTGKTAQGQQMNWGQRIGGLSPLARIAMATTQATQDYGVKEGAYQGAEKWLGFSFAPTARKGTELLDAQFRDARTALMQAKSQLKTAVRNGTPTQVQQALDAVKQAQDEIKRLAPAVQKARENEPPAPEPRAERTSAIMQKLEAARKGNENGTQ